MIVKIFITDPNKRINIEKIRQHPWYQINKPETQGFLVCPPAVQAMKPEILNKNGK
jgi:hypothetical protein